jgi:hypothetical protein
MCPNWEILPKSSSMPPSCPRPGFQIPIEYLVLGWDSAKESNFRVTIAEV